MIEPNLWLHYHFNPFMFIFQWVAWIAIRAINLSYPKYFDLWTPWLCTRSQRDQGGHGLFIPESLLRRGLFTPTYWLQGHSPVGYMILSPLVSTEGHTDYWGSCHLTDSALPGPGSHPGSSWSTAWGQREKVSSAHWRGQILENFKHLRKETEYSNKLLCNCRPASTPTHGQVYPIYTWQVVDTSLWVHRFPSSVFSPCILVAGGTDSFVLQSFS